MEPQVLFLGCFVLFGLQVVFIGVCSRLRYQTDVVAFVTPRQLLSQSSGVGDSDHGSGSCPGSDGTIGSISVASRGRYFESQCVVPTGGQGRADILLFPHAIFVHRHKFGHCLAVHYTDSEMNEKTNQLSIII